MVHLVGMMKINQPKLILFGLSADMPHKGHIACIFTLKKQFPNHTIVVMPCSANPLGKTDINGNIIYPTNGFVRWQMLYDYFQKHDNEIIVSQYEIAINIPSKTYTTIKYLQYTSIENIKMQRGYILPLKYPKNPINEVSIALGTDIIKDLDKWYKWNNILKNIKIIIIKRPGFKDIDLKNISDSKLKKSLMKASIQEISGPQIDISSRKLKSMLQENVPYEILSKYIPDEILDYIKNHKRDFSNAYFKNLKARELYTQAMQEYEKGLHAFDLKRKIQLSTYIADFIKIENIDNYDTQGYRLTNGRLDIDLMKIDNLQFSKQITKWMQENNCEWYETKKPSGKIISPHQFNANFKLLGKFGPNLAIDLIIFIKENNKFKLLTITRNNDKKNLAIPGGFYQGDVLKTAVNEFLEECFSNKLFAKNSLSSKLANKIYANKKNILYREIENILANASLKLDSPCEHKSKISNIRLMQKISDLEKTPSAIIDYAIDLVSNVYRNKSNYRQVISKLKCDIYINIFPENYKKLNRFISNKGNINSEEPSLIDARNTNLAWLSIKSISIYIDQTEWQNLLNECALDLSGGDDAAAANVVDLEVFFKQEAQSFAFHKYLVLRELAKYYETFA